MLRDQKKKNVVRQQHSTAPRVKILGKRIAACWCLQHRACNTGSAPQSLWTLLAALDYCIETESSVLREEQNILHKHDFDTSRTRGKYLGKEHMNRPTAHFDAVRTTGKIPVPEHLASKNTVVVTCRGLVCSGNEH